MKTMLIGVCIMIYSALQIESKPAIGYEIKNEQKFEIKIKNDSDTEITIINNGNGGTYRLAKNIITTIKMKVGDQVYEYAKGKKGKLLLTVSIDMVGKVQLYSKL